jgi:hypothetical protein
MRGIGTREGRIEGHAKRMHFWAAELDASECHPATRWFYSPNRTTSTAVAPGGPSEVSSISFFHRANGPKPWSLLRSKAIKNIVP